MHTLYDPPLDRWINRFLDRWLATDRRAIHETGPQLLAAD